MRKREEIYIFAMVWHKQWLFLCQRDIEMGIVSHEILYTAQYCKPRNIVNLANIV